MEVPIRKIACIFVCILATSAASFRPASASLATCHPREFKTFLHDLNSQCPFSTFLYLSAIQERHLLQDLFWASSLASVSLGETSSTRLTSLCILCSVFSRYGVHSVPSLLIVNQNVRWKYHGRRDLTSLVNFYKRATGLDPVVDMIEDNSCNPSSNRKILKPWNGGSFTEIIWRELYLVLSVLFVLSRAILHFFPEIASRITELWVACIPHLNLGIFGESRQLLGRVFHLIDVKRIWSKLNVCKTRNFHEGARNARVWASSLASVSLGETSSTRIFPSRDL
ncbi:5'-adenylylsulfate reductase-like 5 [Primulina eburnea]|uniref:5'-adenylylsulfate reductase-like 5 n=1 Tax=Primulina eburnea TaxID=1245227 RepID=UPI003C6CB324